MPMVFLILVYLMFLLSGAAGLIYEVIWFRSLSLIFGGSHLAVTTVLSVFMAGLALGSYIIGKHVNRFKRLLWLYGFLELGVALSAGIFIIIMKFYPSLYIPLARFYPDSPFYLSMIRIVLSTFALIAPTVFMGATLPVLSGLLSEKGKDLGVRLAFLYSFNTLGAVAGTVGTGFFLLRYFSMNLAIFIPILINIAVGILAIVLQDRIVPINGPATADVQKDTAIYQGRKKNAGPGSKASKRQPKHRTELTGDRRHDEYADDEIGEYRIPLTMVLWGIGVSGFCALGYEVLWSRLLAFLIGPSIYGFTVVLAAFLAGIGLGSSAFGVFHKLLHALFNRSNSLVKAVVGFGVVQIAIGITAFFVTRYFFELPAFTVKLRLFFNNSPGTDAFGAWQWTNFVVAFLYMFIPACFMGLAFPLAGEIHARYRKAAGRAVGEIMAFNTVGAVLGAAITGYAMIYLVGIERSLQILSIINIGYGVFVISGTKNKTIVNAVAAVSVVVIILLLSLSPNTFKVLSPTYFAIYKSNMPDSFASRERRERFFQTTKVLYYGEGAESIVSSSVDGAGFQAFSTNGLSEASNHFEDLQCQKVLGHLPMLLNKNPKSVLVIGLGSGMTAGATSIHPEVEDITLVEIEPKVVGVAESFAFYNHDVLHNPKLKIIFNDGRNYLLTTTDTYDVITADPVHPFFRGAGYLYTNEYFKLASEHLRPGGIMCQWLPLYRLTPENITSIVKTFSRNFRYTMIWHTVTDVELIGSNSPIIIDEKELARRMAYPPISQDLQGIQMNTADSFLSYFLMGNKGVTALTEGGIVNTDENLYLELSAPASFYSFNIEGENFSLLVKYRESILPYLAVPGDSASRDRQQKKWRTYERVFPLVDKIHVNMLKGDFSSPETMNLARQLDEIAPSSDPWRSLKIFLPKY